MGEIVLVDQQIQAGDDFIRDFNDYLPVSVAFWAIGAESNDAYLYVASDGIDDHNFDVAYGEVLRRIGSNRNQWLDPFQIKLVSSSDPIARDAIRIRDRYPAPLVTRYGGASLGGTGIEVAWIYPPLAVPKAAP